MEECLATLVGWARGIREALEHDAMATESSRVVNIDFPANKQHKPCTKAEKAARKRRYAVRKRNNQGLRGQNFQFP